ncbi:hypothetical protein L873DRAFT_1804963 [Choiromyces venosus 120613-1]|uniref:Uncharacterized protein n=1 Tax=Choiromyces venosus 120613-1 TaxID=1336337 RepID=A0A3N4K3P4_9PEZI|nr:hypothetical protein L873DRAFT_1804963 [Choiromyces venosus 120613-1]
MLLSFLLFAKLRTSFNVCQKNHPINPERGHTEVQRLSFVCSASEVCRPYPLWNIQNLGAVPPYTSVTPCSRSYPSELFLLSYQIVPNITSKTPRLTLRIYPNILSPFHHSGNSKRETCCIYPRFLAITV